MTNAAKRLEALAIKADALTDFQSEVVDTTNSPSWFLPVRSEVAKILGGTSKFRVASVTPNSMSLILKARGFILDPVSVLRFAAMVKKFPVLEYAVFVNNNVMSILILEKENG